MNEIKFPKHVDRALRISDMVYWLHTLSDDGLDLTTMSLEALLKELKYRYGLYFEEGTSSYEARYSDCADERKLARKEMGQYKRLIARYEAELEELNSGKDSSVKPREEPKNALKMDAKMEPKVSKPEGIKIDLTQASVPQERTIQDELDYIMSSITTYTSNINEMITKCQTVLHESLDNGGDKATVLRNMENVLHLVSAVESLEKAQAELGFYRAN